MEMTITEALAEIRLEANKVTKKRQFVLAHIGRSADRIDPLAEQGGAKEVLARELQAIDDLNDRIVSIRTAINKANMEHSITVGDITMTIAEWLVWRRDIMPIYKHMYNDMAQVISRNRNELKDARRLRAGQEVTGEDFIPHVDVVQLQADMEQIQEIEDRLDGLLSLKNAQVTVEI